MDAARRAREQARREMAERAERIIAQNQQPNHAFNVQQSINRRRASDKISKFVRKNIHKKK